MAELSWSFGGAPERDPFLGRVARVLGERFEVGEPLGRGGAGAVYRARERASGREVALKVLISASEGARTRFLDREGALTASLDHPGIVRIHSAGELQGLSYLAYELVEGARPLRAEPGPEGRRQLVERVRDAALAVAYAHERGVVHRDLKPDNVLVDAAGRVRVADFGLAWRAGVDRLTQTGTQLGTPAYMAPEALLTPSSEWVTRPTVDVWGLGAILYEGLTGELPFPAETLTELAASVARGEVTPPRKLDASVPPRLEAACLAALEQDPARRLPDAAAFARELEVALTTSDSTRPALAGGVLLAALVGGGLLGAAWLARGPEPSATPAPSLAQASPTAAAQRAERLEEAERLLARGERGAALSLLDRLAEPPPELVGAALLPELRAAILTGPAPALTLCERPSARALFASEALAEERTRLAREWVLRPEPLRTQGFLDVKSYAPWLAWLRLSGRIRPASARWSADVIERLDEVLGVLMLGLKTGERAERQLRCDVVLACAEVAPRHVKTQQDVAGMVEFLFNDDRPAFEPVVRRAMRLSAGGEQTTTPLRLFLSLTLLAGDPASEEGWRVGLAVHHSGRLDHGRQLLLLDQLCLAAEKSGQPARGADLALEVARLAFAAGEPARAGRALGWSAKMRRKGAAALAAPERERAEQRAVAAEGVLKQIQAGAARGRVETALRALESE